MTDSRDHVPGPKWEFDEAVTDCFEDMLGRSIPGYHDMRRLVAWQGSKFLRGGDQAIDLGSSKGTTIVDLANAVPSSTWVKFWAIEESRSMVEHLRSYRAMQHADETGCALFGVSGKALYVKDYDLERGIPLASDDVPSCSLITSVLTLQFLSPFARERILSEARALLLSRGAMIVVEKVAGMTPALDGQTRGWYRAFKEGQGYSIKSILAKERALVGVLEPMTAAANEGMFERAGFRHDVFWACPNFRAWVLVPR